MLGSNRCIGPPRPICISVNFLEKKRPFECIGGAATVVAVVVVGAWWVLIAVTSTTATQLKEAVYATCMVVTAKEWLRSSQQ